MKVENKFYTTEYEISSPYFKSDLPSKIEVVADIHYQTGVSQDLFKMIVRYVEETNPDFVIMPGDQIETIDFIDYTEYKDFFESIIRGIANVCPVIIGAGNHEVKDCIAKNFTKRKGTEGNELNTKALDYFEGLNRIQNVYFLNDAQTTIKGLTFLGFNPSIGSYLKLGDAKTEEKFIEEYLRSGLKMAEEDYNILVTHSPLQLTQNNVFKTIDDFNQLTDLVVSGHLHDGYLPKFLDKPLGNTNAGLFLTPLKAPYPGIICRGVHDFGRGYVFVSQGYRKWTPDFFLTNAFEKITANDVENLILKQGEKKIPTGVETRPYHKK